MKLYMACLVTETNSFAPMPTGLGGFEEYGIAWITGRAWMIRCG